MPKKDYPTKLEHSEWLRRQNYFLEQQNKSLKKRLKETEDYVNILLDKVKNLSKNID